MKSPRRLASLLALVAVPAFAQYAPPPPPSPPGAMPADQAVYGPPAPVENVSYGYAQVLRVDPVYEEVRTLTPEQRCDGAADPHGPGGDPTGGTVAGAVIGGAAGNVAGKGHGSDDRKIATVVGAIAGALIGRKVDKSNNSAADTGCHTVEVERLENRLAGYDVEYRYKGEVYVSRLGYDPGDRLRVRMAVAPADNEATVR